MHRTAAALERYAPPEVDIVYTPLGADVEVLHTIGYQDLVQETERVKADGHRYAVMQYCLTSAGAPDMLSWLPLWENSVGVWSYYDLVGELIEAGVNAPTGGWMYHAPLGVDSEVFHRVPSMAEYTILTSGYVPEAEAVLECLDATTKVGGRMFHLGPEDGRFGDNVDQLLGIGDGELARRYSASRFVSGMRRIEGFELPAAEGLVCGARPVMFDLPCYRAWYEPFAERVPEAAHEDLVEALVDLFQQPPNPVTADEMAQARERFNWETLVAGFWATVLEAAE
jgi:hypothetical protein